MKKAKDDKVWLALNLSSCNSETSDYRSSLGQGLGPVHSTPRESEQNLLTARSQKSRNDVERYLQKALSQRDKELTTVLRAYESVLIAWERDRHSRDGTELVNKNGHCRMTDDSVLKRCSSIASQSSHDSGHQTDSTGSSKSTALPPEIYPVIELVKAFAQHLCVTQHELDTTKEENAKLKKQVKELQNRAIHLDMKQPEQMKSEAIKDEQIQILANQTAALILQLSNVKEELHHCRKSEKLVNEELQSSQEMYCKASSEVEALKRENELLASKLKLPQAENRTVSVTSTRDEHQQIVPSHSEASHERLHMELNTLKMLVDRQQEVIHVLQKSLSELDKKPTKDGEMQLPPKEPTLPLNAQRRLSELSVECGPLTDDSNFGSSASTLTNISELSCFTWTSRNSSVSTADGDRSASSQYSSVRPRVKSSGPLKLKTVLQSTENDKSILKLNRLLVDSREMLCAMRRSSQS